MKKHLQNKHPVTLLAAFIALILSVFGNVTRNWCNGTLRLLALLLESLFNMEDDREKKILNHFPRDIRTVREVFDVEPTTITYAACPKCSATYPPGKKGKISIYPARCTWQAYKGGKTCGTTLTTRRVVDEQSVRAPIRPFIVQDFAEFKAGLLSQPGMEDAMDCGTILNDEHNLWDIQDGTGIRELRGPDGRPFIDGLKRDELRLAWSLSVDWFNPFLNKAAGKTVSTGSIAMALLNLPPSLRYKAENMYLVGVIPGPKEPSLDEINHFLMPLVKMLIPSWKQGTLFSSTYRNPGGRRERSAVALVVSDLPAARKILGFAHFSFKKYFCSACMLNKANINNVNWWEWPQRKREDHMRAAEAWRDAPTQKDRKALFQKHGIRWSVLLLLEYFNPATMVVVDSMHNLFLGLVQRHFREYLGIGRSPRTTGKHTKCKKKPSNDVGPSHEVWVAVFLHSRRVY